MENRETKFVLVEQTENSAKWEAVRTEVELTEKEKNKAIALGWDVEKVLHVKRQLEAGQSPTEIASTGEVSRNSVYKYTKILSLKDTKKHEKDSKKTVKPKDVLHSSLIFMFLDVQSTMHLFLPLVPPILLAIFGKFWMDYRKYYAEMMAHKAVVGKLHLDFTKAFDLSYQRDPIIVGSDHEKVYWVAMLKHYNNTRRDVIVIERGNSQNASQHWDEKEDYRKAYCSANRQEIMEADKRAKEIWAHLEEKGYLDYLYTPPRKEWEKSKAYLEKSVKYWVENPVPKSAIDHSRKKFIIEDLEFETV